MVASSSWTDGVETSRPPITIDYSLYLVTGRDLLPPGVDYYQHLAQTLRGGKVTVVQIREKEVDNGEFLEIAQRSLEICDKYSVPMVINDNLSVALCLPPRVGLHIGQEDIPVVEARRLLGRNRLLGISVHTVAQATQALADGHADYAGVGPVYGTKSKAGITDDKVLGPRGAAAVVESLCDPRTGTRLPCVLIGGINASTCARSLVATAGEYTHASGVAVISSIVSRRDPDVAAQELSDIVIDLHERLRRTVCILPSDWRQMDIVALSAGFLSFHRSPATGPPLIQTITSHVSSTFSANIALAFSSSPIMSHQEVEAADLGRVTGAVVLNIGTISEESRRGMTAVGREANRAGKPIVLDPVGVGATAFRRNCVEQILNETQVTLIKGNAAELSAIAGLNEVASRGVDSGAGKLSDPVSLVKRLASREKCFVLLTGKIDYLSDGYTVLCCENGHEIASRITGTGCALGVMLAAGMATACARVTAWPARQTALLVNADHQDLFIGALTGLLAMNIAAEIAASRPDVRGPGSFIPALIDEIASLDAETLRARAKVRVL